MNTKKRRALFRQVITSSKLTKYLVIYLTFFFATSLIVLLVEPGINSISDALWYSFASCTTMGFGDFTSITIVGRTLTVILYIYTIFVIAILTALFTQYVIENLKADKKESIAAFLDKLENLDQLSHEELIELSRQVKEHRKK